MCCTHEKDEKCVHNFTRKPEGKNPLGDQDVDVETILKWILKIMLVRFIGFRIGSSGGLL
jgi:hypothetical protein